LVRGTAPADQVLRALDPTDDELGAAGAHTRYVPARRDPLTAREL
jgi:hypothetical protein